MEPKIVKSVSDMKNDVGTYSADSTFGNRFLGERNIRGGDTVADTSAAYTGLPEDIVRKGGIDVFEHPSRESTYTKANFDTAQGAGKPFKPKGRK